MITDARALRPKHVPQDLYHREGALDQLSSALEPATREREAEHVCISGPSGTGKTTIAKYALAQLEREAIDVATPYANCMSATSKSGVLHRLLRNANRAADLRREGTPTEVYLDRLRDLTDQRQVVVVLDEVDVLDDTALLATLYEIPNVAIVFITVDENALYADWDQRVRSRLAGAVSVRLDKYSHAELVDILTARADVGLEAGSIETAALERIADLAAGDARFGIALLRRAARETTQREVSVIGPDLVDDVQERARAEVHDRQVATLSTHQRLLYDIIDEAGEIGASDVHAEYERRARDPKTPRSRRNYLESLERYGLISSTGTGRGTRYFAENPEPDDGS